MSHWRPSDTSRRTTPTFRPIVPHEPLTDAERRRLAAHPNLQAYPVADFLNADERAMCTYFRWWWRNGDAS